MRIKKSIGLKMMIFFLLFLMLPHFLLLMFICGLIDCMRNSPLNRTLFYKYFLGNGMVTWLLSPINIFADVIAMSSKCKWTKEEMPSDVQCEIDHLVENIPTQKIIESLHAKIGSSQRGMIFFKWYGKNQATHLDIPEFHYNYKYIKTIGVSAFNKQASTSRHFGPLRLTYRLLYNLEPRQHDGIYIETNNQRNYWHDNRLMIFDDTYLHQSFNKSDHIRYCLFVDFIRPSPWPFGYVILNTLSSALYWLFKQKRFLFYKAWRNIGDKKPGVESSQ